MTAEITMQTRMTTCIAIQKGDTDLLSRQGPSAAAASIRPAP
jgi:hypothetical protein